MDTLSIDIETFSSIDLSTAGVFRYVESPDFTILLFGYKLNDTQTKVIDLASGESLPPEVLTMLLSPEVLKTAFNASFEITCINKWLALNYPDKPLDISQWEDTMFRAAYAGYLGGLANVAKALGFTQDKQKDKSGAALIKEFSRPRTPKGIDTRTRIYPTDDPLNWEQFKKYNAQDVEVEYEIRKELEYIRIPEEEQKAWELDYRIQASGILVDRQLVKAALKLDETEKARLKAGMRELSGIDNPRSTAQIKNWIVAQGFKSEVKSLRKETVPALIEEAKASGFHAIAELLRLRQELMKSSLAKYSRINEMICEDSRVRGMIQFYGSHTGRWAGRGVQVQNLPRNSIDHITEVRELFREERFKPLSLIYSVSLSDIASQLLRTVFIPSPGKIFAVADYSAIEARVIAWLSGEDWRLEVFRTSGKIYEASAAQMFGVDFEKICDKNAPEHKLRAQGKVAELALGYQGASGAIARMDYTGAIPEDKRAGIVRQWREKSPNIVRFWKDTEKAATEALRTKKVSRCGALSFRYEPRHSALAVRLPSGREIFYPGASLESKSTFSFDNNREKHRTEMYGGRIVENCLAGDTKVLTQRGLVRLDSIQDEDKVWDGSKWVSHGGLIRHEKQPVINVDGVYMTPEHKIYTEKGWKNASSCERYNRYEIASPYSNQLCRFGWQKIFMEHSLRLWKRIYHACNRIPKREAKIVWMYGKTKNFRSQFHSPALKTPAIPRMELNESPLCSTNRSSLEKLWRAQDRSVRTLVRELPEFLGRYVSNLPAGFNFGSDRCEWQLLSGKLPLDGLKNSKPKQKKQSNNRYARRENDCSTGLRDIWNRRYNATLQSQAQCTGRYVIHKTEREEPVYDLKNCGDRHCFTVMSDNGLMLVHNCVQAVARDCLSEAMLRLSRSGFDIKFHVHDEVIVEVDREEALKEIIEIMCRPPEWAPDLPLNAEGFTTEFYQKD